MQILPSTLETKAGGDTRINRTCFDSSTITACTGSVSFNDAIQGMFKDVDIRARGHAIIGFV
jgi:hypothetical protein